MQPDLIERFKQNLAATRLFATGDQIIAAISGGGDSLAMLDLLIRTGQPVILAHCNFRLRYEESDADEAFVRKLAIIYDCPLHVKTFDTVEYARKNGISLEMAARELRYAWFETLRIETGSAAVAVAHHSDDSVETMLLNLIRGTGLRGLTGIRAKNGNIVRPMLFATRQEIHDYLEFRQIEYRTDSSNRDIRFARNRVRHEILVDMEMINPSVKRILLEEQQHFADLKTLVKSYIEKVSTDLIIRDENRLRISIRVLMAEELPAFILYETLMPYGFNPRQVTRILAAAGSGPGKLFSSKSHTLLIDRDYLLVSDRFSSQAERHYFDPDQPVNDLPVAFETRIIPAEGYTIPRDSKIACLDNALINRPLILRRWEKGDFFHPLGMKQSKKVSDFFIDQKINRLDKSDSWILTSGEQIVWIVGHRIDNRFRITPDTTEILEIRVC